jgi:energy-coupling factor transport system permease protein
MMYIFYSEKDSFLHSLDPRVKIIGATFGIAAIMLYNDPKILIPLFFVEVGMRIEPVSYTHLTLPTIA